MARILWLSHEGSWSYMKIFETCVKSLKWIIRVSPHKETLMMCGTNEGIAKRRYKPPIIEDCLLSTPRDHSRWKAWRPRYKLISQDTFGADNIPLIYLWFISNKWGWFNSMPCSYDNHDRLEFLESDKEALLCLKFVTWLMNLFLMRA
jgi:hypothetical protein